MSASKLSTMVGRILTEMLSFGMFDKAQNGAVNAGVSTSAHVTTGQQIAEEGTVLLKNSANQLPLSTSAQKTVAVIGNDASTAAQSAGGGSASVQASSAVVTPVQGITALAVSAVSVQYSQGNAAGDTLPNLPASALTPATGSGNGLTAQFYNNTSLPGTSVLTLNNSTPNTNWNGALRQPGFGGGRVIPRVQGCGG